jgi:hypothetical protein
MPQSPDSTVDVIKEAARSADERFSGIFKEVFKVKIRGRTKEASEAEINSLARIFAREATRLFVDADFTKVVTRLIDNRHASVKALIKDALQIPQYTGDTAASMLQQEGYRLLLQNEKSSDALSSGVRSFYTVFVNTAIDVTQTLLTSIIDDSSEAIIDRLLSSLSTDDLLEILREGRWTPREGDTFEELGQRISPKFWDSLKDEMYLFICTQDKKYASLRMQLSKAGTESQRKIVAWIAAAMAGYIGASMAPMVSLCALGLLLLLIFPKNAFCAQMKAQKAFNEPIKKAKRGGKAKAR